MAPRDTFTGVGVGRKAGSEAGEAIRWGHSLFDGSVGRFDSVIRAFMVASTSASVDRAIRAQLVGRQPALQSRACRPPASPARSRLRRPAVVPRVASRLVKRNNRDWPEDDGALLHLDLEESFFAQTQLTPDLGRHGDPPGRVH